MLKILLQQKQHYGVWNWYVVMFELITLWFFGLEQEDGSFDYFHDAGTSSPSN